MSSTNYHVPVKYPAYRYHATEAPRRVESPEDEAALGPGWFDSPAKASGEVPAGAPAPAAAPEAPKVATPKLRYPCYRYHATEQPRRVETPEEEEALGAGWYDSPAKVGAPEETAHVAVTPPAPAATTTDTRANELFAAPAAEIIEGIKDCPDVALLKELQETEAKNPGVPGGRADVMAAIDAAIKAAAAADAPAAPAAVATAPVAPVEGPAAKPAKPARAPKAAKPTGDAQ